MARVKNWLRKSLVVAGLTLLVIVGLPIFLVASVAMRPLLIAGLLVGSVGSAVAYYLSPAFRGWFANLGG